MTDSYAIALTTVSSDEEAKRIAEALLSQAACSLCSSHANQKLLHLER